MLYSPQKPIAPAAAAHPKAALMKSKYHKPTRSAKIDRVAVRSAKTIHTTRSTFLSTCLSSNILSSVHCLILWLKLLHDTQGRNTWLTFCKQQTYGRASILSARRGWGYIEKSQSGDGYCQQGSGRGSGLVYKHTARRLTNYLCQSR